MAVKAKSKKAPAARPARKALAEAKAPEKKRSKMGVFIFLLLVAGIIGQGAYVFLANKKKDAVLFFESQIAQRGSGKGEVEGARNLAVDDKGGVAYVFGVGEGTVVQAYSGDGKFVARYEAKRKDQALNNVFALNYAPDGTLWACERGSGRVVHLSAKLDFLGSFNAPSTDLPGLAVDAKGQVWVASNGPKIYVYDAKGNLQLEFKGTPKAPLVTAYRLTFDGAGNLLVLDSGRGQGKDPDVKIYSPDGKSLGAFMAKGLPFNEFSCIGADQGYAVLNNNGSSGTDSQGIFLFNYKGKVVYRALSTSNQLSLANVPGLAIGRKGHWALDTTPLGRGCDRFSFSALE
jgi:DNA-binding beta-propeller fold protein YncE